MPGILQATIYSSSRGNKHERDVCWRTGRAGSYDDDSIAEHHHHHHQHCHDPYHSSSSCSSRYNRSMASISTSHDAESSSYLSLVSSSSTSPCTGTPPICWSLPALILSNASQARQFLRHQHHHDHRSSNQHQQHSPTGVADFGDHENDIRSSGYHPLILHRRVADALGIEEGDQVTFSLRDYTYAAYDFCEAKTWASTNNNKHLLSLRASIDPRASFDVAIDTTVANVSQKHRIFDGTMHNPLGNFLMLTNGSMLKLNEQERIFRPIKTMRDLRCAGILLQVEGQADTDEYNSRNHNHVNLHMCDNKIENPPPPKNNNGDGAGCGFCIYASTPLTNVLKPCELLVRGYRYLGDYCGCSAEEAVYFGLWEALLWVSRLDFQTVWIVGSADKVFRNVLKGNKNNKRASTTAGLSNSTNCSNSSCKTSTIPQTAKERRMQVLQEQMDVLLDRARARRIQFKFLKSERTEEAMDLATHAILQRRSETWCHWSTINYQSQRSLPFSQTMARQASI